MTYDEKFQQFHLNYPEVYDRLVEMALELMMRGFKRYSIKTLYCVLRFEIDLSPVPKPYKLNDIYHSRYARLIMEKEPELDGFFNLRELRS